MNFINLPRLRLAHLPTPLYELPGLMKFLGGPRIYIKRDDLTGLAFGGNKTRKLEYLMGDAVSRGADYIVTGAGYHSNWCTQTAAAARRLGMNVVLVKTGPQEDYEPKDYDGNHLLQFLCGAEIKVVKGEQTADLEEKIMADLQQAGHKPVRLLNTGSTPLGVVGHVNYMLELANQIIEKGWPINYLVHATGSGGTQAGLIIGAKAFRTGIKIIGSTTGSRTKDEATENVQRIISETINFLHWDHKISQDEIIIYDQYAGQGYGFMNKAKAEAIKILAETEGIYLDPVYTASAMACLIDLCRQGYFRKEDGVVFSHTGGTAALFPYKENLRAYKQGQAFPWIVPPWSPKAKID